MANIFSKRPGVQCSALSTLSESEEKKLRESKYVKETMLKVRNGDKEAKKRAYYRVPQAMFPKGVDTTTRKTINLLPNGKVYLDYDDRTPDKTGGKILHEKLLDREHEFGVLQIGNTISGNGFAIVKQIEGLSIRETIEFFATTLDLEFDKAFSSIAQSAIITPSSEILFETGEYFNDRVSPNTNLDISAFLEKKRQEEEERAATRAAVEFPQFEGKSTWDLYSDEITIKDIVERCEDRWIDLCSTYNDWLRVGMSIHYALGEAGYEYFYRLSMLWSQGEPNEREIRKKWNDICNGSGSGIKLATLVHLAREANVYY